MALMVLDKARIKETRAALEENGYYDDSRRIVGLPGSTNQNFALPITKVCMDTFVLLQERQIPLPHPFEDCFVAEVFLPASKKVLHATPKHLLESSIRELLTKLYGDQKVKKMIECIPASWEQHGDLIVLSSASFSSDLWKSHFEPLSGSQLSSFWAIIAGVLNCKRLAVDSSISSDSFRSSQATLLLGESGWVDHVDNGIHYVFDITKSMFSSGNITEKLRLAKFDCKGETVVDLYAGIGYFVLPYLIHAQAELVHACEWDPHAVEGLRRGLKANKVEGRCIIHHGDNRKAGLTDIADRVNVGLIPSSEEGWPLACAALKRSTGGWLHVHGNITKDYSTVTVAKLSNQEQFERYSHLLPRKCLRCCSVTKWISYVVEQVLSFLQQQKIGDACPNWSVEGRHVEHVKSYAPHISHLVLDLECRPIVNRT